MKTPIKIRRQLERLVSASIPNGDVTDYSNLDIDELCKQVDTTCKVINQYFADSNKPAITRIKDLLCDIDRGTTCYDEIYDRLLAILNSIETKGV